MKILYLHHRRHATGQRLAIQELGQAFVDLGHEFIDLGPDGVGSLAPDSLVPWPRAARHGHRHTARALSHLVGSWPRYRRLAVVMRRHRPDALLESFEPYALSGWWWRRRHPLPSGLELRALPSTGGASLSERIWRSADLLIPSTDELAQRISRSGVDPARVAVMLPGVNSRRFPANADLHSAKSRLGLSGRLVVAYVGTIEQSAGLDWVVDMLADSGDRRRHFLIVGEGPERTSLQRYGQDRGVLDRMTFSGWVAPSRVASYLAAVDIALLPRVLPYAWPTKLTEYLAMDRAIVAPDAAAFRDGLRHEDNAVLFTPEQPLAFRAAIERLCADNELRAHIAGQGRATVARLGLDIRHRAAQLVARFRQLGAA